MHIKKCSFWLLCFNAIKVFCCVSLFSISNKTYTQQIIYILLMHVFIKISNALMLYTGEDCCCRFSSEVKSKHYFKDNLLNIKEELHWKQRFLNNSLLSPNFSALWVFSRKEPEVTDFHEGQLQVCAPEWQVGGKLHDDTVADWRQ